ARTSAESARATVEQGRVTVETRRVTAETGRTTAETDRVSAESARTTGDAARQVAFDAAQSAATALSGMTVAAAPVAAGAAATATVSDVAGHKHVAFGIPTGLTGNGIASFARTAGSGAAGTTDTYTLTMTDGSTKTVPIYNGRDGQGAGDMLASKYDPDGDGSVNRADIAGALDARAQVALAQVTGLADALAGKQPAQAGKGLSANDLTDARVTHYDAAYTHAQSPHAPTVGATQSAAGLMSAADKVKLDGVASQATKNDTDSNLKSRANHTGTQEISTVEGLQTILDGKAPKLVIATAILTVAGWTGSAAPYTQMLSIAGVPADQAVLVYVSIAPTATVDEIEAWSGAMVMGTAHAAGAVTFEAKAEKPTIALPVVIAF
ncbi:MAG: hypothetical protein RSC06_14665, partial [Clostridia bacterium]